MVNVSCVFAGPAVQCAEVSTLHVYKVFHFMYGELLGNNLLLNFMM